MKTIASEIKRSSAFVSVRDHMHTLILMLAVVLTLSGVTKVKADPQVVNFYSDSAATYSYFAGLLTLALAKVDKLENYDIKYAKTILSQGRVMRELLRKDGLVDVYPTGTSIEREKKLLTIRVPLLKGTLGYRIPIIHKDSVEQFEKIKTVDDLKQFVACQGEHWPDSDILEGAGLKVMRNDNYQSMFTQTLKKYCDYFPRAIFEGYSEMETHNLYDTDLVIFDKLLIIYPFPMYFLVSPHHQRLADDVERGLKIAIKDGSFGEYFNNSISTKNIFPLSKWDKAVKIRIANKTLPFGTPVDNPGLWLDLETR